MGMMDGKGIVVVLRRLAEIMTTSHRHKALNPDRQTDRPTHTHSDQMARATT